MTYIYGGIYGYGEYGTALYGIGNAVLDDEQIITILDTISKYLAASRTPTESIIITDVANRLRNVDRSASEYVTISDSLFSKSDKAEVTKIFINGNITGGGTPSIINIMNSIPTLKNITNGNPVIRRSIPYGYGVTSI